MFHYLFILFFISEKNINLRIGDPPIDVDIKAVLDGQVLRFAERVHDSFAFFLSPNCKHCKSAIHLASILKEEFDVFLIFVGEKEDILVMLEHTGFDMREDVYLIADKRDLIPYNLVQLPVALAYKDNGLQLSFGGSFDIAMLPFLRKHYNRTRR